jgi:hypothetical protein
MISYQTVVEHLRAAGHRLEELTIPIPGKGKVGKVAVSLIGGRVIGMAFSPKDENLIWSNPELSNTELLREHPERLLGGIGGDRLWFGPEFAYHWKGKPDLVNFKNYKVPESEDPGEYHFILRDDFSIKMRLATRLSDRRDRRKVSFKLDRTIISTSPPLHQNSSLMRGVDFVGFRTQHYIQIQHAAPGKCLDLWHLLQMPAGSTLMVPIRGKPKPLEYFNKGSWEIYSDHLSWKISGQASAKIGFDLNQVTGRTGVIRRLSDGRWVLLIRQFPVLPGLFYCDGPSEEKAGAQVVQCWDGFGFGEMEYHSPAVGGPPLAKEYAETSLLWAFGGSAKAIEGIAKELLGISIRDNA